MDKRIATADPPTIDCETGALDSSGMPWPPRVTLWEFDRQDGAFHPTSTSVDVEYPEDIWGAPDASRPPAGTRLGVESFRGKWYVTLAEC